MPTSDHQIGGTKDDKPREDPQASELARAVGEEIVALHEFFVGWFGGTISADDESFSAGFVRRFDPACVLVSPGGTVVPLAQLTKMIHAGHGKNPAFRIEIRNVVVRREHRQFVLATYEEWQKNALNSKPPDNARVSSVWFKRERSAVGGLAWMHIHECWLPPEQLAAGPWDF